MLKYILSVCVVLCMYANVQFAAAQQGGLPREQSVSGGGAAAVGTLFLTQDEIRLDMKKPKQTDLHVGPGAGLIRGSDDGTPMPTVSPNQHLEPLVFFGFEERRHNNPIRTSHPIAWLADLLSAGSYQWVVSAIILVLACVFVLSKRRSE